MTDPKGRPPDSGDDAEVDWPVPLRGVTETVVTTLGPNERWNAAALGVFAGDPATALTWGNTRTRRNFHRTGEGHVQFTRDPVDFVEAALSIYELDEPLLESADAWARVRVGHVKSADEHVETADEHVETADEHVNATDEHVETVDEGTVREEWSLVPVDARVERRVVPTINRGFGAVVEATVAASRLGIDGYDESILRGRLDHCASVIEKTGGEREREAMNRVRRYAEW